MQPQITSEYLSSQGLSNSFQRRFWKKVLKTETCWIWKSALNRGYGVIQSGGSINRLIMAHRASWILHRGPIPEGLFVLHNCPGPDNSACVNPDHLYIGGHLENGQDRIKKLQSPHAEGHYRFKVSTIEVMEIRASTLGQVALGEIYGVGQSEISRIKNFKRRLHG